MGISAAQAEGPAAKKAPQAKPQAADAPLVAEKVRQLMQDAKYAETVAAIDEAASELIDPDFKPPLRRVAPVSQLSFEEPAAPAVA